MSEYITRRELLGGAGAMAAAYFLGNGCAINSNHLNKSQMPQESSSLADIHIHTDCAHSPESIYARANEFQISAFQGKTLEEIRSIISLPKEEAIKPAMNAGRGRKKMGRVVQPFKRNKEGLYKPKSNCGSYL